VIIAGGGAKDAGDELTALAEALDAPVVLTGNAKGVVASRHPLCAENTLVFGRVQRDIEAADAALVVGSELSDTDLYNNGRALAFTGSVVRIDIDEAQISRRVTPSVGLVGEARATLEQLRALIHPGTSRDGAERARTWREHSRNKTSKEFAPWLAAIEEALPDDAIVALDSTQLGYSAHWWLPANHSRSWLAPYGFGTLGCALPMAIGASVAAPERPVLAIAGDGGWLFTVAEMASAVDLDANVTMILWDNRGYQQIKQSFDDVDAPRMGVDVSSHDPLTIAKGFGWSAQDVTSPDELADLLRTSLRRGQHLLRICVEAH